MNAHNTPSLLRTRVREAGATDGWRTQNRVVLDLQACQSEASRGRGIGRYSGNLATALLRDPDRFSISIALNDAYAESAQELSQQLSGLVPADRIVRYDATIPLGNWEGGKLDAGRVAGEVIARHAWMSEKPDLVHVSSLFEGLVGRAVVPEGVGSGSRVVFCATAYDVIPLIFATEYLADEQTRSWYQSRIDRMRRCDLLLAISESTRSDVIERVGFPAERIVTIMGAADARFRPAEGDDGAQRGHLIPFGLVRPYVMYTGGIDHRKNVEGLIRAFGRLPEEIRRIYQLAIVCDLRDGDRARLADIARKSGVAPESLILTGYVADDLLLALYQCCHLFVFPSQYEGFGLPVLEAMCCGAPTIAADNSSLSEIVGRHDALFRSNDDDDLARTMARALQDSSFLESLRSHGLQRAQQFTWRKTAARAKDAWADAIARHTCPTRTVSSAGAARTRLPRLALVTPLDPERSGIAHVVSEWLPNLARYFDVDLYCSSRANKDRYRLAGYSVRPWETLPGCWLDYDAGVLYQMGNSEYHAHMLALLCVCPGTVLLHDAYLSGLMTYCEFGPPKIAGLTSDMLAYCHPDVDGVDADLDRIAEQYPMSRWVADHALGIIVTSKHALALLREYDQVDRARCAIMQLHQTAQAVSRDDRIAARRMLGIPAEGIVACTFGRTASRKLSIELLKAWGNASMDPQARLVFVGEAEDGYGTELRARARAQGGSVSITGYVDDATFRAYLMATDMVVQLRTNSRGEASASSLYALAFGNALITSRHGSAAEIPSDVCVHIEEPFDSGTLARTLAELARDTERRDALGRRGSDWIRENCDPLIMAGHLAAQVLRFNDREIVFSETNAIAHLQQFERLVANGGRVATVEVARARLARGRAPRLNTALARSIEYKLRSMLPSVDGWSHTSVFSVAEVGTSERSTIFSAGDSRLRTGCGVKNDGTIEAVGVGGVLMYGPYVSVPSGQYRVRVYGSYGGVLLASTATIEIVCEGGQRRLVACQLPCGTTEHEIGGLLCRVDFTIAGSVTDLEFRVLVQPATRMIIESVDLVRLPEPGVKNFSPRPRSESIQGSCVIPIL